LIAIGLEDGDALTWVRLSIPGDSVLIRLEGGDDDPLPLGRW
jgi:DNA gyrase subunit A